MESKPIILVVEDDRQIRNFICASLGVEGYQYIETNTGSSAISLIASHNPDVVILDLGLPDIDGLEVISKVREWSRVKIIVVSARGQEKEKVEALDVGADDFLTKPFSVGELMARIRVSLRQIQSYGLEDRVSATKFQVDDLTIDYVKRKINLRGKEVHLTPIEYNLIVPFFCSPTNIKTIISLKHTRHTNSDCKLKLKTALENAVNKPFSRAALFIFSPAVRLFQRAVSHYSYTI